MLIYFYKAIPLVILGTVLILIAPWLALFALFFLLLAAVATVGALAWAIITVPLMLVRAIRSRRLEHAAVRTPRALATR